MNRCPPWRWSEWRSDWVSEWVKEWANPVRLEAESMSAEEDSDGVSSGTSYFKLGKGIYSLKRMKMKWVNEWMNEWRSEWMVWMKWIVVDMKMNRCMPWRWSEWRSDWVSEWLYLFRCGRCNEIICHWSTLQTSLHQSLVHSSIITISPTRQNARSDWIGNTPCKFRNWRRQRL